MTTAVTAAGTTGAYGCAWLSIQSPRKPPAATPATAAVRRRAEDAVSDQVARPLTNERDGQGDRHRARPRLGDVVAGTGFRRLLLSVGGAAPEASAGPAADDDGGEAGGGAEAEGVPRAGHVGQHADDG